MKKVLFIVSAFFFFLIPTNTFASDYKITDYNIDITVNENNILDIKEDITVNFTLPRHGIYRYIPLKNYVERTDNTTSLVRAKVKKVKVNKDYEIYTENNNKVIQIGSADYTVTGPQNYQISYSYDLGRDKNKGFDELYLNIIGTGWETTLSNVTFQIHMPKDYNQEKFGISTGKYGVSGSNDVKLEFIGNDIKGTILRTLEGGEAVTTRIELEDNYFKRELFEKTDYVVIILPILLTLMGLYLWKKHGIDDPIIETVEFYPPDNYNSAEIGYIYKNNASDKDVVSLLIYLANKGYIKIEESKGKKFTLTKVKDYDGENAIEREFLENLFKEKETVKESDLSEKFYMTITSIKFKLTALRHKIYAKKSDNQRIPIGLFIAVIILLPVLYFVDLEEFTYLVGIAIILVGLLISFLILACLREKGKKIANVIILVITLLILLGTCFLTSKEILEINYATILLSFTASLTLLLFSFLYVSKRTPYGTQVIGQIQGFKNFLETAEKPKLEELVMQDPEYFYNILPYTYVLGVSDKWIKKFESIAVAPPNWYYGNTYDFNMIYFSRSINRTMNQATKVMTSIPAPKSGGGWSSSSGGFGGGGFSGGGSGGGGGGAW